MRAFICTLACVALAVTCFFAIREPASLLFILPIFGLVAYFFSWIASKSKHNVRLSERERRATSLVCCLGFLLFSVAFNVASLVWVNSMTPIFGEGYTETVKSEKIQSAAKKETFEREKQNVIAVDNAEASVKSSLKDPSSAMFSGGFVTSDGAVCGYVNAKNSFGAYSGNSRYISVGGNSSIDDGSQDFNDLWLKLCR